MAEFENRVSYRERLLAHREQVREAKSIVSSYCQNCILINRGLCEFKSLDEVITTWDSPGCDIAGLPDPNKEGYVFTGTLLKSGSLVNKEGPITAQEHLLNISGFEIS